MCVNAERENVVFCVTIEFFFFISFSSFPFFLLFFLLFLSPPSSSPLFSLLHHF